jgi:hypothetical protein
LAAPNEHDRSLRPIDPECSEQRLRAWLVDVQPVVQNPVTRGELPHAVRVAVEARPHDLDAHLQSLDRLASPQQRLQDEIPENQLAAEERAELVRRHDEQGTRLSDDSCCTYALARQDIELDHQIARPLDGQFARLVAAAEHHRNATLQHHHNVVGRIALAEQDFADMDRPDCPVPCQQSHLLVRQLWEQRRIIVIQQGSWWAAHCRTSRFDN